MAGDLITPAVLIAMGGGVGAIGRELIGWLKAKPSKARDNADLVQAAGVFQAALNAAADGIVARLEGEIARQGRVIENQDRVIEGLRADVARLGEAHDQCQTETEQVRGELREQRQVTESLVRELRAKGVDVTDLTGQRPLIVLHAPAPEAVS